MTTANDIREWFDEAKRIGSTHMIVVCDTFDHEDYPIGVYRPIVGDEQCLREYDAHNGTNMQRVMEVYDLRKSWESQSSGLTMNLPERK
jgi:hypothetical protein